MRLAWSDATRAAEVLGRAFYADPLFDYVLPGDGARRSLLPAFFGVVVRYCVRYGAADTTPALDGVACWLPPGQPAPGLGRLARLGLAQPGLLVRLFRAGGGVLRRLADTTALADELHHHLAPDRHWYLWALGVDPARQGQGVGGGLVQHGLARADAAGLPCYLETNQGANVAFYQRHGFKLLTQGLLPGHGVSLWTMRREPAPYPTESAAV